MNEVDRQRLVDLEKRFAGDGETLTQADVLELETLRDLAGQGSLPIGDDRLDADVLAQREQERFRADQREEITRRLAVPLRGNDGGEQAFLFGDPILL